MTSPNELSLGHIEYDGPARVEQGTPCDYRLARKPNGEIVLQSCHLWTRGADHGWEWRDRLTVDYEAGN